MYSIVLLIMIENSSSNIIKPVAIKIQPKTDNQFEIKLKDVIQYVDELLADRQLVELEEKNLFTGEDEAYSTMTDVLMDNGFDLNTPIHTITEQLSIIVHRNHTIAIEITLSKMNEIFDRYKTNVVDGNHSYFRIQTQNSGSNFQRDYFAKITIANALHTTQYISGVCQSHHPLFSLLGKIEFEMQTRINAYSKNPLARERKRRREELEKLQNAQAVLSATGWIETSPITEEIRKMFTSILNLMNRNTSLQDTLKNISIEINSLKTHELRNWELIMGKIEQFKSDLQTRPKFEYDQDFIREIMKLYAEFISYCLTDIIPAEKQTVLQLLNEEIVKTRQYSETNAMNMITSVDEWSEKYKLYLQLQFARNSNQFLQDHIISQINLLSQISQFKPKMSTPTEETWNKLKRINDQIDDTLKKQRAQNETQHLTEQYEDALIKLSNTKIHCLQLMQEADMAIFKNRIFSEMVSSISNNNNNNQGQWRQAASNILENELKRINAMTFNQIITSGLVSQFKKTSDCIKDDYNDFETSIINQVRTVMEINTNQCALIQATIPKIKKIIQVLEKELTSYQLITENELSDKYPLVADSMLPLYWLDQLIDRLHLEKDEALALIRSVGSRNNSKSDWYNNPINRRDSIVQSLNETSSGNNNSSSSMITLSIGMYEQTMERYKHIMQLIDRKKKEKNKDRMGSGLITFGCVFDFIQRIYIIQLYQQQQQYHAEQRAYHHNRHSSN